MLAASALHNSVTALLMWIQTDRQLLATFILSMSASDVDVVVNPNDFDVNDPELLDL